MKRIYEGKTYDTETAEEIGYHEEGEPYDPDYWKETLYRNTDGEFFVSGEGEPYCIDALVPINEETAKWWVNNFDCPSVYEELWGEE